MQALGIRARDLTHVPMKDADGGGAQFLAFIRDRLMPFIDARYPTDPKDIGNPSLWWANEDMKKVAEQYLKTRGDLPARVFLGVGGLEELPPGASFRMVTNVLRLERMLRTRNCPGLQLTTRIFPDESHTTVVGMNLVRGLGSVFDPPVPGTGLMALYEDLAKRVTPR